MWRIQIISILIFVVSTSGAIANFTYEANCIITNYDQVSQVLLKCNNIVVSNLRVPAGKQLKLALKSGSKLRFEGTTVFDVAHWDGPLLVVEGSSVYVEGAPGSVINGQGEHYWDGKGTGGVKKPSLFSINTKGASTFKNIKILNCPIFCVKVHSSNLHLDGWNIDVSAGKNLGRNTDAFDVAHAKNVIIENTVVTNQDDCVVVVSGSNMIFRNLKCYGSHGLSFSLGSGTDDNADAHTIQNVTFSNCLLQDGAWGIHVKTKRGNGLLTDVTYENIEFRGLVEEGIYINQDYQDPGNVHRKFKISNLKLNNIWGSVGPNAIPVRITCNVNGCSNFHWSKIYVNGRQRNICNYNPNGFNC